MSKKKNVSKEEVAAGAGIAALALLSRLTEALVANKRLSAEELREALDDSLLSLEKGQADSPIPEASTCARHCLEQMLDRRRAPADGAVEPRSRKTAG